jgi:hypothetical protein
LDCKAFGTTPGRADRYKVVLSDGVMIIPGMLMNQLNELVINGTIQVNSIVQLNKYLYQATQHATK